MCLQKVLVIIILVEVSFFLPLLAFCLLGWCKVGKCVVDVKKYERHLLKCEIQIRKWVESKFHEFWWMWKVVKCERWCGAQRKPDEVCQGRRQRCERRTAEVCPWFLSGILRPFCWSSQSFWGVGGEDCRVGSKIVLVLTFIRVRCLRNWCCAWRLKIGLPFMSEVEKNLVYLPCYLSPLNIWQIDLWKENFLQPPDVKISFNCHSQQARGYDESSPIGLQHTNLYLCFLPNPQRQNSCSEQINKQTKIPIQLNATIFPIYLIIWKLIRNNQNNEC